MVLFPYKNSCLRFIYKEFKGFFLEVFYQSAQTAIKF